MNKHFLSGARAALPACLGVIPVGISFGLLAVQAGLRGSEAVAMSVLVMAGASQLMAVGMIAQGAAFSAIVLATFFINLRHLIMSGSAMRRIRRAPLGRRLLCAFALCDESFAVFSMSDDESDLFLLGANTALFTGFVASTVAGCLMTSVLPQLVIDSFGIAFYAALLGLLLPGARRSTRLLLLVVFTAGLNALAQCFLPASWAVILSMMLGALAGVFFVEEDV